MRAGTWATVIAILVIIAIGWWTIDRIGEDTGPAPREEVVGVPPPATEDEEQHRQQTVGETAPPAESRPAD